MTAQMLPGILSGHSAPVPGVFLLFTVMPPFTYYSVFFCLLSVFSSYFFSVTKSGCGRNNAQQYIRTEFSFIRY
ncbi:hypothetical protein CSB69_2769 [Morganella morganii]|nr:hypothetical protein CSB69_2769 [Morganella morganii]EMP53179.1 hypothetical protein C790_03155 [Morganella morganii SC01]